MDKYVVMRLYEEPAAFMHSDNIETCDDMWDAAREAKEKSQEDYTPFSVSRYDLRDAGYHHFMGRVAIAADGRVFSE